jgi:hypothetical protein
VKILTKIKFYDKMDIMKALVFRFIFLIIVFKVFSQTPLEERYQILVMPFVEAVKNNDRDEIVNLIHYPLRRQYPIPYIYNKQEMLERYDQVFDKKIIDIIKNSPIETSWDDVGWRGIMLSNGLIWIDYDGKIYGINYQSSQEETLRNNIISETRNNIHESLREFKTPSLLCKTENYIIRVDLLQDDNYRLALWLKEKEQTESPDIILTNGEKISDGNGGNHYYLFDYNNYQYILYIDVLSKVKGHLIIHKGISIKIQERINENNILVKEEINKIEN